MLLILTSVLFGYAVIEITKTLLSLLPWLAVGVQRPHFLLALMILLYFVLNSVRYVWAHVKLSAYAPLVRASSRRGRLAFFIHDLMFPLQAMIFVAMALILTIPGVPVFSSLPPQTVRSDLLVRYFDTLVAGFLLFNLLLATLDLLWCKLMERMLFAEPSNSGTVCSPPDLTSWRNSSAEEVVFFSISALLLLVATKLSFMEDRFAEGPLVVLSIVVILPWVTLLKEFWENLTPDVN